MSEERNTNLPIPKVEQYYYDYIEDIKKPLVNSEGSMPVVSTQKKWKDSFSRTSLNEDKWEVFEKGGEMILDNSVAGSMVIRAGVVANSEVILRSKEYFSVPARVLFMFSISQRIANQEIAVEFISIDSETLEADDLHTATYQISFDDSITANHGVVATKTGGTFLSKSATFATAVTQTAQNIYEIELFPDEVWFHTRVVDSSLGRANSQVRNSNIPDPNALYKVQIRVTNKAIAPASNTLVTFQAVTVVDYAELTAEITAGRGNISAGQGISTTIAGGILPTVTTVTTVGTITTGNVRSMGLWYLDTVTNLLANAVFLGVNRTIGSATATNYSKIRVRVYAIQSGTLYVEQSRTTTTTDFRCPVGHSFEVNAGECIMIEVPAISYYARVRYVNGSVAQTGTGSFEIITSLVGVS